MDRSPIATDTFLCTYCGAASDIIPNEQAEQKVLIPEIRKKLAALHNVPSEEFEDFLKEHYFDLHYQPQSHSVPVRAKLSGARVFNLSISPFKI